MVVLIIFFNFLKSDRYGMPIGFSMGKKKKEVDRYEYE